MRERRQARGGGCCQCSGAGVQRRVNDTRGQRLSRSRGDVFRRPADCMRSMMTMAVNARAVLFRAAIVAARFAVLLDQRCDFRFVRAFSRFCHRRPEDAESGAQRNQLQHEGSGEEPGHLRAVSSRILVAKEYSRKTKCDFITVESFYLVHSTADRSLRPVEAPITSFNSGDTSIRAKR